MADLPPPSLRLRIDTQALADNWRVLDAMSGGARAGAAVKADCYGLGVGTCLPVLRGAGCRDFFAAHWSEVHAILQHIPADQLSILHGPVTPADADYAMGIGVRPVINSLHQAELWVNRGGGACDLMVDTGINRLGIGLDELQSEAIQALNVNLLMSHLACADEDSAMNARQLQGLRDAAAMVDHAEVSLANSAGIPLGADYHFDLTRPGLSLYGGVPREELGGAIKQVAYPQAAIIQTRAINAGDSVGYNAAFTASGPMRVGVVSLGYADGVLRSWAGGAVVAGGASLPILGRVSMDMIVVDLANGPDLREGDWVNLPYFLPDAAQQSGLSQYELLTILGQRFRP